MLDNPKFKEDLAKLELRRKSVYQRSRLLLILAIVSTAAIFYFQYNVLERLDDSELALYLIPISLIAYRAYEIDRLKGSIREDIYTYFFDSTDSGYKIDKQQDVKFTFLKTDLVWATGQRNRRESFEVDKFRIVSKSANVELGSVRNLREVRNGALYVAFASKFEVNQSYFIKPVKGGDADFDKSHKVVDTQKGKPLEALTTEQKQTLSTFENKEGIKPFYFISNSLIAALIPFSKEVKEVTLSKSFLAEENFNRLSTELSFNLEKASSFKSTIDQLNLETDD